MDQTLSCADAITYQADPATLGYSNGGLGGCLIEGTVTGTITGSFDECGGALTQTWTFTDNCGRIITHTQNITVEPAPQAQWINAPEDITISNEQALSFDVSILEYSNNDGSGVCLIEGSVTGVITGTYDECGGTLTQDWTFTDNCGRTITHTQTITVLAANPAVFTNPPADSVITCDQATAFEVFDIEYSNSGLGGVLIQGTATGVLSGTYNECGGTLTQTWSFVDNCDRTITHTQTITVLPAPEAVFDAVED